MAKLEDANEAGTKNSRWGACVWQHILQRWARVIFSALTVREGDIQCCETTGNEFPSSGIRPSNTRRRGTWGDWHGWQLLLLTILSWWRIDAEKIDACSALVNCAWWNTGMLSSLLINYVCLVAALSSSLRETRPRPWLWLAWVSLEGTTTECIRSKVTFCNKLSATFYFKQCCGSVLDPYSGALWIRIWIPNTDPDPGMYIYTGILYL